MKKFLYALGAFVGGALLALINLFTPVHNYKGASAALVKYGEMIADLRGKINGTVHSRNKAGAYMRNLVIPTNPQTAFQQAVRATLTGLSQAWRGLTEAQRDAWNAASVNFPSINVFGDVRELSGISLYNQINLNLDTVGVAPLSTPPAPTGADAVNSITGAASTGPDLVEVTVDPDPVPAGMELVIFATPNISPGINNFKNRLRLVQTFAAAAAGPHDITAAYTARFGALTVGQKIGFRAKLINIATGEVSQTVEDSTIVT